MERAREIGRNLLSTARGGSSEEKNAAIPMSKRRSWSDVVSSSPPSSPARKTSKEVRVVAGMPKPISSTNKKQGPSPGKESSQKVFSVDDVAKLVEIARNQLRKEKELTSGWKEIEHRDTRNKEKTYARDLVEGFRGSPEGEFKCWQCDQPGHKSSDCPKGERCFACNSQGHKWAECLARRKLTRKEKGKALDLGDAPRSRPAGGIHIGERLMVDRTEEVHHKQTRNHFITEVKDDNKVMTRVWKKVPDVRTVTTHRPGRQHKCRKGRGGKRRI